MTRQAARTATIVAVALGAGATTCPAQEDAATLRHAVRAATGMVDRFTPRVVAPGVPDPRDKPRDRFSPDEKARLRAMDVDMAAVDEPPFPVAGLAATVREIAQRTTRMRAVGEIFIAVRVEADGTPSTVRILRHADLDVAEAVAYVVEKAQYKPALCGGKPCAVELPFRALLRHE